MTTPADGAHKAASVQLAPAEPRPAIPGSVVRHFLRTVLGLEDDTHIRCVTFGVRTVEVERYALDIGGGLYVDENGDPARDRFVFPLDWTS